MSPVSTTRMELLSHRQQLELAGQGRDLLEKKRTALMQEIVQIADTVLEDNAALKRAADQARLALAEAESVAGFEAVQSASLGSRREFVLQVDTVNVMGVRVPHIEQRHALRPLTGRGYAPAGTPAVIDEAAEAFELEIEAILRLAVSELRLKSLLYEIQRTSRRLNAIEQVLMPGLRSECDIIQNALDERERADQFRLKMVRRVLEKRRSQ